MGGVLIKSGGLDKDLKIFIMVEGGRSECSSGNLLNLDLLNSSELCKFLYISRTVFSEFCIRILL